MMLAPMGLFTETITRTARSSVDPAIQIEGCSIQSGVSTEPDELGRNSVITAVVVFVPATAADSLTAQDTLIIRRMEYRIEGQPVSETSIFTGARAMTPVNVQRVTG